MDKQSILSEISRVLIEESDAIGNLSERIDDKFYDAVELICNAKNIITTGVGKSGMIARKIAATFSSIGFAATFLDPVDALHGDIGYVHEGDVAILLSKSGSTEEIVRLVPHLKMRQSSIISIVGNLQSYLGQNTDIALDAVVTKEACPFNWSPTSSTTLAIALGDALAMACIKFKGIMLKDISVLHPLGQLNRNFNLRISDIMHSGASNPKISPQSKFKDAVIEISNKKLGCVCVVNDNDELLGIITDGDVRRVMQKVDDIRTLLSQDVMTAEPVSINDDALLSEALLIMENRESQINVLPVLNHMGKCVGVIRMHDILRSGL